MVIKRYVAELLGTFVLVLLGSMSILAAVGLGISVMVVVPFGFGLALMVGIYAFGHVSGAHFNPAVTLGMWLDKRISTTDLIGYWISQIFGGLMASLILRVAGVVIALTLTGVHFAGIPFSGSSVNPARSFGPALVGGDFSGFWVYVVAPLAGVVVGAVEDVRVRRGLSAAAP